MFWPRGYAGVQQVSEINEVECEECSCQASEHAQITKDLLSPSRL